MFGDFNIVWLIMGFCGGIFGAAIGALPSFVLCGFGALVCSAVCMATGKDMHILATWGPLIGPQSAFAGGTAAAAFAKKIGKLENGRDICTPLMGTESPSVLLVGGIFGLLGTLLTWFLTFIPNYAGGSLPEGVSLGSTNQIAFAIIICMILSRVFFGSTGVFGKVPEGKNRWESNDDGCWVPWQSKPSIILLTTLAIGTPTAYLAKLEPNASIFVFSLGCIAFIYLQYGTKIPIFHHIALSAFWGTFFTGSIVWGLALSIMTALLCEVTAIFFVYHGDTHIDPPTFSLTLTGAIYPALLYFGIMPYTATPKTTNPNEATAYIFLVCVTTFLVLLININRSESLKLFSKQKALSTKQ